MKRALRSLAGKSLYCPESVQLRCNFVRVSLQCSETGTEGNPSPRPRSLEPRTEARTSGDSSSKMTAPRVSTWMVFAVGNEGPGPGAVIAVGMVGE